MIIPAFVLMFSWILAPFMVVYKNVTASEALHVSNKITYGHKWTIFCANLIFGLISLVIIAIPSLISWAVYYNGLDSLFVNIILTMFNTLVMITLQSIQIGIKGSIWNALSSKI